MPRTNAQEDLGVNSALNKLQEHPVWPFRKRWSWPIPPPQECVCWTKHMWIYHRWQTKCTPPPLKDSFIPEQITTLIKNNENEGTLSSVVQMPQVYCLHPQRSSTCVWLCLWHKQIDLHENKRQKNVWYCSNMQRSCMWERSWQKTVCWLHLSLRLLRKSSRFLLIIHVRFNAS